MTDKVVYSSDPKFCTACGRSPCVCADRTKRPKQPEPVRISFMHPRLKEDLLSKLKRRLGCGGTVADGTLELQGDHRDIVESELKKEGYPVRRIGG